MMCEFTLAAWTASSIRTHTFTKSQINKTEKTNSFVRCYFRAHIMRQLILKTKEYFGFVRIALIFNRSLARAPATTLYNEIANLINFLQSAIGTTCGARRILNVFDTKKTNPKYALWILIHFSLAFAISFFWILRRFQLRTYVLCSLCACTEWFSAKNWPKSKLYSIPFFISNEMRVARRNHVVFDTISD